jgi:hypothetical protein
MDCAPSYESPTMPASRRPHQWCRGAERARGSPDGSGDASIAIARQQTEPQEKWLLDPRAKKQGATGITTVAPYVAGQWGRGDNRLPE